MMTMEENCRFCSHRLRAKETHESVLLFCTNAKCRNYWFNQGAEIIMMLK